MKILHTVEFYHPSVGGMQEVVKQLSERLVKMGHDVTIATTKILGRKEKVINGVKIVEFEISGNLAMGLNGEVERYKNFLVDSDFDIVTNFAAQQWATDVALTVLDDIKAKKVFVPTGFSGLYVKAYRDYFEQMKGWMRKYDMNVFLSDNYRDINFAKENDIEKRILIPNGAGEDEFLAKDDVDIRKKYGIPQDHFLIIHVGSHTGSKGHKEAMDIFRKSRIKNATFLIIGNKIQEIVLGCYYQCRSRSKLFNKSLFRFFDKKKLLVESLTRKDTVSAYKQADLFLFPSNIECSPIVLFEAMASKTPFLTSDVGNAEEIINWSRGGVILPTTKDGSGQSHVNIKDSALILENMFKDKNKRLEIGGMGFESWKKKFSWEKISKQYESMYYNLIKKDEIQ